MTDWIRICRKIHLALALVLGAHFALIATTGALYVFDADIRNWAFAQNKWKRTAGDVGPQKAIESIRAAYVDWNGAYLVFPTESRPFYAGYVIKPSSEFWIDVFVDPGTGNILGTTDNSTWCVNGILHRTLALHTRLCAGETGRRLVGISTSLLLFELITGILLWVPRPRLWRTALKIHWRQSKHLLLYDLHRVAGVIATPVLLIMIATGLLWSYPKIIKPLVYQICGETLSSPKAAAQSTHEPLPELTNDDTTLTVDQLVQRAVDSNPGMIPHYFLLGSPLSPEARIRLQPTGGSSSQATESITVLMDRRTGELRPDFNSAKRTPSLADKLTREWAYQLHVGTIGGRTTQIIALLACLTVDLLFFTGLMMWWNKRSRRRHPGRLKETLKRDS
ncbi:PepSY-associated TM helix domain-containing protein [Planctomicrobium sp. SH668]|uniref:PepSY-associated TM helix domain-containing protein n=1 Tax=Planctomicrobium sp. SH668 TaxID=3448126 RepID=UPI003F5CAD9C